MSTRHLFPLLLSVVFLFGLGAQCIAPFGAAENYQEYCSGCHGENLKSFVDRDWVYGNSWNEVFRSIKYGYPDDGMSSYDTTFSDQEIKALTNYILKGIEDITKESFADKDQGLPAIIESDDLRFRLDTVVSGLEVPWGMDFLPEGGMILTDRGGQVFLHRPDQPLLEIQGVPAVRAKGQGGMLDVAVHPRYAQNGWIYLSFSKPNEDGSGGTTAVVRGKIKDGQWSDEELIFEAKPYVTTRHHYGSRLQFDRDGYLFISVGDRGRRDDHPQSLGNFPGKIHRLLDDGSIPSDNPFADQDEAIQSIWSYGHRNPQGLALHPETGELWENEHGPRGGDEINQIEKGKNYGWPVISYGINYTGTKFTDITEKEGMEQPFSYWVPSIGVCGMCIVGGDRYPAWEGDILSGSLRFGYLHRTKVDEGQVAGDEKLLLGLGRLRAIEQGPDGYLYIAKEDPGYILRLIPLE